MQVGGCDTVTHEWSHLLMGTDGGWVRGGDEVSGLVWYPTISEARLHTPYMCTHSTHTAYSIPAWTHPTCMHSRAACIHTHTHTHLQGIPVPGPYPYPYPQGMPPPGAQVPMYVYTPQQPMASQNPGAAAAAAAQGGAGAGGSAYGAHGGGQAGTSSGAGASLWAKTA